MNDRDPITGLPRDPNAPNHDTAHGHEANATRPLSNDPLHNDRTVHTTTTTDRTVATPVRHDTHTDRKPSILPWILGGLALLGLLWYLFGRDRDAVAPVDGDTAVTTTDTGTTTSTMTTTTGVTGLTADRIGADLDAYFTGTEPLNRRFTLDQVNFRAGSAAIGADGNATITALANTLKKYPSGRVTVIGSASPEGDAAANRDLSLQRANAVKNALVKAGVNANAITAQAVGESGAMTEASRKVEMIVTAR